MRIIRKKNRARELTHRRRTTVMTGQQRHKATENTTNKKCWIKSSLFIVIFVRLAIHLQSSSFSKLAFVSGSFISCVLADCTQNCRLRCRRRCGHCGFLHLVLLEKRNRSAVNYIIFGYNKFIYLILFRLFACSSSITKQNQCSCSPVPWIYACACGKSELDAHSNSLLTHLHTQPFKQEVKPRKKTISSGLPRAELHLFWMKFKFDNILIYSDDGLSLTDVFGGRKLVGATMSRPIPPQPATIIMQASLNISDDLVVVSFRRFFSFHFISCSLVWLFRWLIFLPKRLDLVQVHSTTFELLQLHSSRRFKRNV